MIQMREKIDRLAAINKEQEKLKIEKDSIEAELLKQADEDLANTKYKSVRYQADTAILQAIQADSVKVTYEAYLPLIFGKAYPELCKEKRTIELTAPAKRLIAGLWKGDYNKTDVVTVISAINTDNKTKKLLLKKCKGIDYNKDKNNLMIIAKMSETDAEEYAYMIAEAAIWQQFVALLELNEINNDADIKQLLYKIQQAFVVEETPKIKLEV